MTIATTNVAFSAIQTEFGGANPISVSEYLKGGSYVPSNQTTSATDGNAIPTSASNVRIGMFRGLTKTTSGNLVAGWSGATSNTSTAAGTRSASFTINTNGTTSRTPGTSFGSTPNWFNPTTTGIGSSYWVRATESNNFSCTRTAGTMGTWLQITSGLTWTYQNSGVGIEGTVDVTFEFAASSGGAVLASGTCSWDVGRIV